MPFRIAGAAQAEPGIVLLQVADELGRVLEVAGRNRLGIRRQVATQREDVRDAKGLHLRRFRGNALARRHHAGEVGERRHPAIALHVIGDSARIRTRRAAGGAVGDGHERRLRRGEFAHGVLDGIERHVALRREHFERDAGLARTDDILDLHRIG